MKMGGKNLQKRFLVPLAAKPENKRAFSSVEPNGREKASLNSLVPRKHGPASSRKSLYRDPQNLKPRQVHNLYAADTHATRIGIPINRFVTVSWLLTEHGKLCPRAFQSGMKRMCQWLRDNGAPVAWIYVHECPVSEMGDDCPNTHILIHVPAKLLSDFNAKLDSWFGADDGGVKSDARRKPGYWGPDRRLQYMTKGADELTCRRYGGRRKRDGQGRILIKRCGTSQNLGWQARERYEPEPS